MTGLPIHYWILRGLLIVVILATIATVAMLVPWSELLGPGGWSGWTRGTT